MHEQQVQILFERTGLDAFAVASHTNVLYLCGANIVTQKLMPDRLAIVLWPRNTDPTLIVCTIEESLARRDSWIKDIRGYIEFKTSPIKLLAEVLDEKGLGNAKIGIEKKYINAHYYDELRGYQKEAELIPCDKELQRLRMLKTKAEIDILRNASTSTDKAIRYGYEYARSGMTERNVADLVRQKLFESGAEDLSHFFLGAGSNSFDPHNLPGSYRLSRGDIIRMDVGGNFTGYRSDLARTAVVGKPDSKQLDNYKCVRAAKQLAINAIKPGVRAKDLYAIYKRTFEKWDLPIFLPHVGHSIGIEFHEHPILNPFNDEELKSSMMLEVEIVHFGDNRDMYHDEDLVLVTETGHEVVSSTANWEELFVIQ
jgi:Xaa-Pro aminopeptidase